jgi:hypothetical protein
LQKADGETDRLNGAVIALAFEALMNGVRTSTEALYIVGFPTTRAPIKKRSDPGIE